MNTKTKGDITTAKILTRLLECEIPVSIPFGDNQRYDLIAEFSGSLQRIQCKTARWNASKTSLQFQTVSSTNHTTNKVKKGYCGEIDYFATSVLGDARVFLIPISVTGNSAKVFTLTLEESHQNQWVKRNGIDYLL